LAFTELAKWLRIRESRVNGARGSKGFQPMMLDLPRIFQLYVVYYAGFRNRFDQFANPRLSQRLRAPLLSYEEFTATWIRWCDQGQENYWRERFEKGYEFHAMKSETAIKALFTGSEMHLATQEAA
jgi:hypothetical protein